MFVFKSDMFSYISSLWKSNKNKDVGDIIQNTINDLSKIKNAKYAAEISESVEPSINYLSRNDVYTQASKIVNEMSPCKITSQLCRTRGVYYLEMTVVSDIDGRSVVLEFWPCTECACIKITKLLNRMEVVVFD